MNKPVKRVERKSWTIQEAFLASLVLHASITSFILWSPKDLFKDPKPEKVTIELVEPEPAAKAEPAPPIIRSKPIPLEKQQIVDQEEKPINDEKSEDTRFLSANNQVVKKQTVAANRGDFKNSKAKKHKDGKGGAPEFKPMTVEDFKPKFDVAKLVQEKMEMEKNREKMIEEAALAKADNKKSEEKPQEKSDEKGEGGDQASQTIDYIKDLDPGLETLLSTKEFVYYTYYARIRRQLNQHWGPKVREKISKIYKQGRSIASSGDRITKLLITLDRSGKLQKVQVIGDSGIRDLDEAAVEAFRAAAPFPNPPDGMVDPDGWIKIRWDFILEA